MQNEKIHLRLFLHLPKTFHIGCRLIIFLTLTAQCHGRCTSSVFQLYKSQYLPNHVIKEVLVSSQLECSILCLRHECESWNFYETTLGLKCELNNGSVEETLENSLLKKDGATFGRRIEVTNTKEATKKGPKKMSYVFTTLGATGHNGPTDTIGYLGTTLENQVTLQNGTQEWRVPHTGTYEIMSRGAAGANGTCTKNVNNTWQRGGLGAELRGRFLLSGGTLLKIVVGQRGIMGTDFGDRPGGGGGGSFVTYANNTPLIIAGGGGGGGGCNVVVGQSDGDDGQLGVFGSRCNSTAGHGGMLCSNEEGYSVSAGSGAGFVGDGATNGVGWVTIAMSFVNGTKGGTIQTKSNGGFGGGGYGFFYGGGGGGYTGGGVWGNATNGIAGGGGSINHGFDKKIGHANTLDHGMVKIVLLA